MRFRTASCCLPQMEQRRSGFCCEEVRVSQNMATSSMLSAQTGRVRVRFESPPMNCERLLLISSAIKIVVCENSFLSASRIEWAGTEASRATLDNR
jgi:hypothetical protein